MVGLWFPAADPVSPALIIFLALAIDAAIGDPPALWRIIPHPVALLGGLIGALDRNFNAPSLRPPVAILSGAIVTAAMVCLAAGAGWIVAYGARQFAGFWLVEAAVASVLLAARGLHDHVRAVAVGLDTDVAAGRAAVHHIVGRDPESLDEDGVARAAIESAAENFSDGVVAPVFWFVLFGLPGLCACKAVNTLDSMIGHRNDRYLHFGRMAARLDDAVNWLPARLAGILIVAAAWLTPGARAVDAGRCLMRDGGKHASPNAGRVEAPMAGALGVALAGPRLYGGVPTDAAWLGTGRRDAGPGDIRRALKIYVRAVALLGVLLAGISVV